MTVLPFPVAPRRAHVIELLWGDCRAYYPGDLWTDEFQTAWFRSVDALKRELRFRGLCQRLPTFEHQYDQGVTTW